MVRLEINLGSEMTEAQGIEKLLNLIELAAIAARDAGTLTWEESVAMRVGAQALARGHEAAYADASRMRWLLAGNGYFMEENMLCGHGPCDKEEQDEARRKIDEEMAESANAHT